MKNVFKVGKSFLRQTAKNKNLFFTITVLLLLFVSLQGQWSQLYAADNTQSAQRETEAYPATPEGVVEAFVKADFEGGEHIWEQHEGRYTTWQDAPGWDTTILVSEFKIVGIKKNYRTAEVKVEYKKVGEYYFDDIGPVFKKTTVKEVVIYKLIKKDDKWKIERPKKPPYFDVKKIIVGLRETINEEKNPVKLRRIKEVLRNIENIFNKNHGGAK